MKSRYIKRRKKFHYIIISVTIIVCLLGTVFTSFAILDSSRDLLIANAVNELNTKMDYIKNGIVTSPNTTSNGVQALRSLRKNENACFILLLNDVFCVITCCPHFTYKNFLQCHRNG